MQLIQQTIHGNHYWWNDIKMQWEGLEDNGTLVSDERLAELVAEWETEIDYFIDPVET